MSKAGGSARQRSERMRDQRVGKLRRRWPMVVVGVAGAFALGFYLPSLVFTAVSSFLVALVPDSGGLDVEIPFMFQLALGASLGTAALIGLVRPSQGERAWRKGSAGERRVGRTLDRLSRSGVRTLHDRKMPGSAANIDHVAVTPAGVFTIETKAYRGRLEVRGHGTQLWINRSNRTSLVDQAKRQADAVRSALGRSGVEVPIHPLLCFVDTELPLLFPPRHVGGVIICTPNGLSKRLLGRSSIRITKDQVAAVAEVLDSALR